MMGNGKSQHHSMFDWATDHSGTFPANNRDLADLAWGEGPMEDVTVECEEEESQLADLQREFAENVRAQETLMSMTAMNAAAEQVAMEGRRIAAREAVRKAEAASRAQAEEEQPWGCPWGQRPTRSRHASTGGACAALGLLQLARASARRR
jgi:hypothetical protein